MEVLSGVKLGDNPSVKAHSNKRNDQYGKLYSGNSSRKIQSTGNSSIHGRRGPGLYRPTVNETSVPQSNLPLNLLRNRTPHFKPSLTPGLGTRRVVYGNSRQDANLRFSMEPRLSDEAFDEWVNAIRRMARLGDGLPSAIRSRVWSTLADRQLAKQHVDWDHVIKMAFNEPSNKDDDRLGEQIVKDLHRTGCEQFGSDSDQASLKRVLLAYARWNRRVGYCQGFNVIAAAVLDVTARDEKKAFKIMVYLIDYVLPESYFAQNLQALSVDIAVFRQLLQTRLPGLAGHLDRLQYKAALESDSQLGKKRLSLDKQDILSGKNQGAYEPPLMNVYIIQWFLTLFATCLASDAVLRVWDSILLEGSEVILRTAIVIMEFLKSRLLKLKSADQFYATMSDLMSAFSEGRIVSSQELLFEIYELAPFPYPGLKELREKFMYNVTPLVLTNMNINSSDSIKNAQNSDQKKTGIFNLLKYIPTSLKKSESVQPISSIKSLVKSKNEKYLKESIESFTVVKSENVLSAARERQKHHNEINNTLPNTDKRSSSTAEVRDTYQEISLTPDIHSEKSKESHRKILSCSGTQNVPISDINVNEHNKKLRKFVKPQLKEAVKCFSTLWPEKTYDSRSIFSSRSCFSDSISVKSLHSFVEDSDNYHHYRHTVNIFRLRSLPSSPIKNCETKASSDISQIGPGAVSDAPQLRPIRKTSSVDEARMTTNVKQLESVYKRQQACQRSSVIILPNNFLKSNCHANLIIVLPQKKYKLVNLKSFRDFYLRNCPPMKSKSLDFYHSLKDSSGKEFTHADAESRHTLNFSNKEANDSLTDCICTDKNIIGAVRSWQEGAVWSVSIDDDNNTDVNLKSTSEELSGEDSSLRPYENRKPRLCELASFEGMHFCSPIKYSCSSKTLDDYTVSHDDNNEGTPTDSSVRDTNSPYSTNITYSKKFISDFVLMNMIKHHNERKEADVLCDSKPSRVIHTESPTEVSNEDVHSNATETASFYTSISTSTRKKLPWEEAAASFAPKYHSNKLNSSVTFKKTNKPFSVKIPLTQSRKKFGAKFGIYDDINYKNSPVGSGFIDHIEVITSVCEVPATR